MGRVRKLLLLVIVPFVLLGAGLELLGRIVMPPPPADTPSARMQRLLAEMYEYDPDLIVRLQPNRRGSFATLRDDLTATYTTNGEGFRGPDDPEAGDEHALRILVLGDSVTFGYGVGDSEAWPAVLQRRLQQRSGARQVQVRNLGVPGYSTCQGRILLERELQSGGFAPQLVVFAFGFNDGFLRPSTELETRAVERFRNQHPVGIALRWLTEHSRFAAWILARPGVPTTPRVPIPLLLGNLDAAATLCAARQAELLLADACLPHRYVWKQTTAVAEQHGVRRLAFRAALQATAQSTAGSAWPTSGMLRIEVPAHGAAIPPAAGVASPVLALVLATPEQRAAAHVLPLNDDGRDGDAQAGDGTWSGQLVLPPGSNPEVALWVPGLAASLPHMANALDCINGSHLTAVQSPDDPERPVVVRLEPGILCPWPDMVLGIDIVHPNAKGQEQIAAAVEAEVFETKAWAAFMGK